MFPDNNATGGPSPTPSPNSPLNTASQPIVSSLSSSSLPHHLKRFSGDMLSELFTAGDHLPSGLFETGGFTPWDTQENQFLSSPQEPIFSFSSSDNSTPKTTTSSDEANGMDERKKRRMVSNRESARRSRMRKQKHLENLRNRLNRLKVNNRELTNRLRVFNLYGKLVREENRRLQSESVMLQQRLWDIRQVLVVRQLHHQLQPPPAWPCHNNVTSIYEQYPPSLIT